MMDEEDNEENGHGYFHHHFMRGPVKKEFKLAMLEKKEKIIRAKLDFIEKMKDIIKKMPEEK